MKRNLKRYLIAAAVGLGIAFAIMLIRKVFAETDTNKLLISLCDAFFISGMCLVCAGALVFVSHKGMFYMFAFGISMIFTVRRKDMSERKYKDFYEYKMAKEEEKKESPAYLLLVGLAFVALSCLFFIWIDF